MMAIDHERVIHMSEDDKHEVAPVFWSVSLQSLCELNIDHERVIHMSEDDMHEDTCTLAHDVATAVQELYYGKQDDAPAPSTAFSFHMEKQERARASEEPTDTSEAEEESTVALQAQIESAQAEIETLEIETEVVTAAEAVLERLESEIEVLEVKVARSKSRMSRMTLRSQPSVKDLITRMNSKTSVNQSLTEVATSTEVVANTESEVVANDVEPEVEAPEVAEPARRMLPERSFSQRHEVVRPSVKDLIARMNSKNVVTEVVATDLEQEVEVPEPEAAQETDVVADARHSMDVLPEEIQAAERLILKEREALKSLEKELKSVSAMYGYNYTKLVAMKEPLLKKKAIVENKISDLKKEVAEKSVAFDAAQAIVEAVA